MATEKCVHMSEMEKPNKCIAFNLTWPAKDCGEPLMERTDLPFSLVQEQEIEEWKKFRRALRKEDQQFLDELFEKAKLHVEAGDSVSRPWPFETILVSILLEQEKALCELEMKIRGCEAKEDK